MLAAQTFYLFKTDTPKLERWSSKLKTLVGHVYPLKFRTKLLQIKKSTKTIFLWQKKGINMFYTQIYDRCLLLQFTCIYLSFIPSCIVHALPSAPQCSKGRQAVLKTLSNPLYYNYNETEKEHANNCLHVSNVMWVVSVLYNIVTHPDTVGVWGRSNIKAAPLPKLYSML